MVKSKIPFLVGMHYFRQQCGCFGDSNCDVSKNRFPCDTVKIGKNLDYKGYGIATSKSSGLHASVNQALLNLQNLRVPEQLQDKWWRSECPSEDPKATRGVLSLANVVGAFFFLAAFLGKISLSMINFQPF